MTRPRRVRPADRPWLDGPVGWLVVAAYLALGLAATSDRLIPILGWRSYPPLWLAGIAIAVAAWQLVLLRRRPDAPRLRPLEAILIAAAVAVVLTDAAMLSQPLRDLGIYLKAGDHFLRDLPVYSTGLTRARPADLSNYPFLYPPLTLPFFGLLALMPRVVAGAAWVAGSLGLAILAMRLFGLRLRFALLSLVWPPLFEGLWVGNVAAPALALFAIGPWLGAALVLGAVFKAYSGIGAVWLVRERRWIDLAAGLAIGLALIAVTLPFVGLGLWTSWLAGLRAYNASQPILPSLYGFGLPRYLPSVVFVAVALAAVVVAARARGRIGLARLGIAIVVASPSLFGHGVLVTVPALLMLPAEWLWLAVAVLSLPDGPQWWIGVAFAVTGALVPALRRVELRGRALESWLHPLGEAEPWPDAPFGEAPRGSPAGRPPSPAHIRRPSVTVLGPRDAGSS